MYTVQPTITAGVCYANLRPDQRARIDRIITNIRIDPGPDPPLKTTAWQVGAMYTIYRDHDDYWVIYHLDGSVIWISAVGYGDPAIPDD